MSNAEKAQKLSEAIRQGMQAQGDTLSRTQQFQERLGINFGKLSDKMFGTLKTVPERMEGVGEVQKDLVEKPSKGVLAAVNTAENVIKSMRDIENATQIAVDAVQDFGSKLTWLSKKITGLFPQDESVGGSKMSNVASAAATSAIPGAAAIKWLYDKIPGYAIGGIASGDKSGHLAMLHGTEAVIPLAGGAIPVSITGGAAGQGEVGSGPAFSKANEFSAQMDKVIKALDDSNKYLSDIYDEILGGATVGGAGTAGGASSERVAQEALAEHDHAHPHEPAAAASPELAAQIGKIVNPLEKMTQTSGMMRNDGKTYHGGIDLAGKIGDKIMAPISGVARVLSEKESGGYGNMVEVTDATTGVKHMLAHMDKTMVKTGDVIKAGQQIGTLGNTGKSTGAHLHHEMRDKAGNKIDPSQFYSGPGFGSTAGGAATGYPQMVPKGRRGAAGATAPMSGGVKGNLDMMTRALQEQGITDPKMINATLANVMKETGGKINVEEDLAGYANTSNERIRSIFGARAAKKSDKELDAIKKDPKQFAEMMYGKDSGMGLGNVEEGDAYKFRGRGAVGLTGRANYAAASKDLFGDDRLVKDPELLKDPEMAAKTSAWFMKKNTGAMAQRMGMAGGAKTQEEANLLATSTIAGQAITPGQGFLGKEALGKVTAYSAQLAGGQTPAGAAPPATAVAAAPVTGFAPGAQQPAAQPTTLASMAQNVLGSIFGGGGGTTAGIAGPTAPAAGSDMASITAALQAQTAATQTAITSGMENMTTRLVASLGTTGGVAGGDPAVPALLGEMVAAQREQTTAINRLIQVQTA
jgi:putative chitinase